MKVARAAMILWAWLVAFGFDTAAEPVGDIEGRVIFEGEIPKSLVADDSGARDPLVVVDSNSKGIRDVVVYLKSAPKPTADDRQSTVAKMDQINNRFVPRVIPVRAGQKVLFTNSDAGNHNVRAVSSVATNEFNVFTSLDGSYQRAFAAQPDARPIRIGCDIHPWMRGWIYVFDHLFFAVTDAEGRFRITGAPIGTNELVLVQPDLGYTETKQIIVRAGELTSVNAQARPKPRPVE